MTAAQVSTEIVFTRHAVERYRERIRPALAFEQVGEELGRIAELGTLRPVAPGWLADRQREVSPLYLELAGAVFPLKPGDSGARWHAVTCVARGGLSPLARGRRNAGRQARRRGPR